jgi:hypothetical protein
MPGGGYTVGQGEQAEGALRGGELVATHERGKGMVLGPVATGVGAANITSLRVNDEEGRVALAGDDDEMGRQGQDLRVVLQWEEPPHKAHVADLAKRRDKGGEADGVNHGGGNKDTVRVSAEELGAKEVDV